MPRFAPALTLLSLLVTLAFGSAEALARATATQLTPPGGAVHAATIATLNGKTVLLASTEEGVQRSTDGGKTWGAALALAAPGISESTLVSSPLSSRVYALGNGVFASSPDAGASWLSQSSSLSSNSQVSLHPTSASTLMIIGREYLPASRYAISYSADAGQTWQSGGQGLPSLNETCGRPAITRGAAYIACTMPPASGSTQLVHTYRSTDNGMTWDALPASVMPPGQGWSLNSYQLNATDDSQGTAYLTLYASRCQNSCDNWARMSRISTQSSRWSALGEFAEYGGVNFSLSVQDQDRSRYSSGPLVQHSPLVRSGDLRGPTQDDTAEIASINDGTTFVELRPKPISRGASTEVLIDPNQRGRTFVVTKGLSTRLYECACQHDGFVRLKSGGFRAALARFGGRFQGSSGDDILRVLGAASAPGVVGAGGDDVLIGGTSADILTGGAGDDRIVGNAGKDLLRGNSGKDRIIANDGARDTIQCGAGKDMVIADRIDRVSSDCEAVRRR